MAKRGQGKKRHAQQVLEGARTDNLPPNAVLRITGRALTIVFSDEKTRNVRDVSELQRTGELATPFATAIARVLALVAPGDSRRTKYKNFKHGYLAFIARHEPSLSRVSDIDGEHVLAFIAWLDAAASLRSEAPLTLGNRRHKLGCLKDMLVMLAREHPEVDVANIVPRNPWGSIERHERSSEPLQHETLRKLVEYVEREVAHMLRSLDRHLPPTCDSELSPIPGDTVLAAATLQEIIAKYNHIPQNGRARSGGFKLSSIMPERPELSAAFGVLMGPTARQLHLLYTYLLIFTGFNEQPLRDLDLQDIEVEEVTGLRRTTFASTKLRARADVRRTFVEDPNDVLSVHRVVDALIRWTRVIRSIAQPELRGKLFIFRPGHRNQRYPVGSFATADAKGKTAFRNSTAAMSKAIGDKYIGPRAVRGCAATILHDLLNGDLRLVSLGLGHKSTDTTNAHYRPAAVRDSDEWWLSGVMTQRERYFASSGKVDPRQNRSQVESTAATPGWTCIDNMTSPIEGQRHGRACTAYPHCPKCPHSQPHPDRAYSLARTIQLYAKIEQCVAAQGLALATHKYGELIPFLNANQMRLEDPDIVRSAANMRLSPLPDLD